MSLNIRAAEQIVRQHLATVAGIHPVCPVSYLGETLYGSPGFDKAWIFRIEPDEPRVGASRYIVVSKLDGRILYEGTHGE